MRRINVRDLRKFAFVDVALSTGFGSLWAATPESELVRGVRQSKNAARQFVADQMDVFRHRQKRFKPSSKLRRQALQNAYCLLRAAASINPEDEGGAFAYSELISQAQRLATESGNQHLDTVLQDIVRDLRSSSPGQAGFGTHVETSTSLERQQQRTAKIDAEVVDYTVLKKTQRTILTLLPNQAVKRGDKYECLLCHGTYATLSSWRRHSRTCSASLAEETLDEEAEIDTKESEYVTVTGRPRRASRRPINYNVDQMFRRPAEEQDLY